MAWRRSSTGASTAAPRQARQARAGRLSGSATPGSLAGHHQTGKGELVLLVLLEGEGARGATGASSRPPVAPAASRQGLAGPVDPKRRAAATAAIPTASTASPSGDPRGSGTSA